MKTLKNKFINWLSILAGRSFAKAHNSGSDKALARLERYISLRQMLPKINSIDGTHNHMGNHYASGHKPWKATQGA